MSRLEQISFQGILGSNPHSVKCVCLQMLFSLPLKIQQAIVAINGVPPSIQLLEIATFRSTHLLNIQCPGLENDT